MRSTTFCSILLVLSGCSPQNVTNTKTVTNTNTKSQAYSISTTDKAKPNQILAQGRLQPAKGLIRLGAIPGDKVEQVLVKPGQKVRRSEPLIVLQSLQLRGLELEAATLRLEEARGVRHAKQQEAELAIDAANLKLQSAIQLQKQALSQLTFAKKGGEQIASLERQVATLQKLRESPTTRAAIGTIDLESKKNELNRASSLSEQSLLAAQQSVEMSNLQVLQGEKVLASAKESRKIVDQATPIASLEKQIDILKLQQEQASMLSPLNGVVINVNTESGERTAQLPLIELADLSNMVCVAEVHESDVAKISMNDLAEIRSSALSRTLKGRLIRVDRVVGAAQLRSPNPMARSDFRSIPVWIEIDADDIELAAERLQLQVDVSINITR